MKMYFLIIKGSVNDAERALIRHNLESFTIQKADREEDLPTHSYAYTSIEDNSPTLHLWFNEDLGRESFVPGSLLFFNLAK